MGYTTINGFEDGTLGHFDAQTNAGMDFPHYTKLAQTPGLAMPYRGAYCARVDLALAGTDGAWVQETASWDTTTAEDIFIRLKFWLSKDAAMAANDVFSLIEFWSATNTAEACAAIKYTTAAGWEIGIGNAAVPSALKPLTLGEWHDLEVVLRPAAGTGTIDGWLDGVAFTQVASLTIANITSGIVGANPGAAFTPTAGTLLIDEVIGSQTDDTAARIGSHGVRFPEELSLYGTGHAFVGHGIVDNVSLIASPGASTDGVLTLYDTDRADATNSCRKLVLRAVTAAEAPVDPAGMPIKFTKGCYVVFSGTDSENMSSILNLRRAVGYGSDGAIRRLAFH